MQLCSIGVANCNRPTNSIRSGCVVDSRVLCHINALAAATRGLTDLLVSVQRTSRQCIIVQRSGTDAGIFRIFGVKCAARLSLTNIDDLTGPVAGCRGGCNLELAVRAHCQLRALAVCGACRRDALVLRSGADSREGTHCAVVRRCRGCLVCPSKCTLKL